MIFFNFFSDMPRLSNRQQMTSHPRQVGQNCGGRKQQQVPAARWSCGRGRGVNSSALESAPTRTSLARRNPRKQTAAGHDPATRPSSAVTRWRRQWMICPPTTAMAAVRPAAGRRVSSSWICTSWGEGRWGRSLCLNGLCPSGS